MNTDLIFDVGLHKGEDSEFYLRKGFKVVAIEAVPSLCDGARERLRHYLDTGQLTILNLAIAEKSGPIKFFVNESISVWGTISAEWAKRNERLGAKSFEITVEGIPFHHILKRFGVPYYLKIDIEGADLLCLQALRNFTSRPKYVSIESTKTSWSDLVDEFALFKSLGYSKFKLVQQHTVKNQTCPFPAREGLYVNHRFEHASSGLFGEEAPGEWLSEREALKLYRKVFVRYRLFGDAGIFRRLRGLLSRLPFARRLAKLTQVGWYDTHASI